MSTPPRRISRALRLAVYEKYGGRCAYCGSRLRFDPKEHHQRGAKFEVDHLVPKAKGGTNDPENLMPSCHQCNWWKSDRSIEDYRRLIVFRRDGVPFFSKPQRAWLARHVLDMDEFETGLAPHVFHFEREETPA